MNVKVLLAFVVGVVLASGVAFYAVKKTQTGAAPAVTSTAVPSTATAIPTTPANEPAQPSQAEAAPVSAEKPSPSPVRKPRHEASREVARNTAPPPTPVQAPPAPQAPPQAPAVPAQQQPAAQTPEPAPPPPPVQHEAPPPPPRQPHTVTIPAGTLLSVRLGEGLSTDRNAPGDSFSATLDQPLVVDGLVIAERGARAEGRVVESRKAGRVQGVSDLAIELVRLTTADGQKIRVQTETFTKQGEKEVGKDVAKVGAAAGIGAAIGAIAGGGRGAAIGAAVGGAAGTGGVMATRGKPAELRVETRLSLRLRDPVTVTERLK